MPSSGTVIHFSQAVHSHLIPYIAAIHASCINHDQTIATFLPPLSHEKLLAWWKDRLEEVAAGSRLIFLLVSDEARPDGLPSRGISAIKGPDVVGVCMLSMPVSETGPMRGLVEKLLVLKSFRGRGGATALMREVESQGLKRGRSLLLLDTETGCPAELLYKKLGYVELGKIPAYGKSPSGELKSGTFFYKQLEDGTADGP